MTAMLDSSDRADQTPTMVSMSPKHDPSPNIVRRERREDIARIAASHGARNVRVFGSAGREDPDAADLDLLVEMRGGRTLFDLIDLSQELTEELGIEVDVLSDRGLSPYLSERILAEAVPL